MADSTARAPPCAAGNALSFCLWPFIWALAFCYNLTVNLRGMDFLSGGCYWNNLKNIVIGDKSYINGAELITTNNSKIIIGANCLISYDVVLRTDMHIFEDKSKPILEQGVSSQNIKIGNNVWIGHGVYVMPGITIGDNSIIGAKAVVTKDIPSDSIAVGVPARVIKKR